LISGGFNPWVFVFCPVCKVEYRQGITRCADCGAELVPALPQEPEPVDEPLEIVWRGSDPLAVSKVQDVLEGAGVEFQLKSTHDHLAFGLGMPRPFYEVLVRASDYEKALSQVAPVLDTLPLGRRQEMPPEDEPDKPESS
jgi:hypothetical protein